MTRRSRTLKRNNPVPDVSWCIKGGSRGYVTTRPLEWPIGKKESGWRLTVATGREFESSVPELKYKKRWLQSLLGWFQPFTWLMRPDDPFFLKSACIHDVLLEDGYRVAFADSQWFEAALSDQADPLKSRLAYMAMRMRHFWR